jgi:hypothetical protein
MPGSSNKIVSFTNFHKKLKIIVVVVVVCPFVKRAPVVSLRPFQCTGVYKLLHQLSVYVRSSVQGYTNYYVSCQSTSGSVHGGIQITTAVISLRPVHCTGVFTNY